MHSPGPSHAAFHCFLWKASSPSAPSQPAHLRVSICDIIETKTTEALRQTSNCRLTQTLTISFSARRELNYATWCGTHTHTHPSCMFNTDIPCLRSPSVCLVLVSHNSLIWFRNKFQEIEHPRNWAPKRSDTIGSSGTSYTCIWPLLY